MTTVRQVAEGIKNVEVFKPTNAAVTQWEDLLKEYQGVHIPDDVVKQTQLYQENVNWINEAKKAGYNIIDIGGDETSTFYNMEKKRFMERKSRIEIVSELITKTFHFLEDLSFTSSIERPNSTGAIESIRITFDNYDYRREIMISYREGKVDNDVKYTFSISIIRKPYKSVTDFFSLSKYLTSINKDANMSMINCFDEKEAEGILIQLADALKTYTINIINGSEWLDNYWPEW